MNQLAKQLDKKLQALDPARAQYLESLVREAFDRAEKEDVQGELCNAASEWPVGYFEQTSGSLKGEEFQRPNQGELPIRDDW